MIAGDVILDHDPAIFLAEDLNPVVSADSGLTIPAAAVAHARPLIDLILLATGELDALRGKLAARDIRSNAQHLLRLCAGFRQSVKRHIAQIPLYCASHTAKLLRLSKVIVTYTAVRHIGSLAVAVTTIHIGIELEASTTPVVGYGLHPVFLMLLINTDHIEAQGVAVLVIGISLADGLACHMTIKVYIAVALRNSICIPHPVFHAITVIVIAQENTASIQGNQGKAVIALGCTADGDVVFHQITSVVVLNMQKNLYRRFIYIGISEPIRKCSTHTEYRKNHHAQENFNKKLFHYHSTSLLSKR